MHASINGFQSRAKGQAEELMLAISAAESVIVTTIERECEALRDGRMLAAKALHTRLGDAANLYLHAIRAARASLWTMEQVLPGTRTLLEERRTAFSSLLKVELAVLAAQRAAAGPDILDVEAGDEAPVTPTPRFGAWHHARQSRTPLSARRRSAR
jgi:hypothetical protein